jgi:predicted nucleotidyltransferase
MLYYNYDFPTEEVESYVRQILCVPVEQFIQRNIEMETTEAITPKDVFQFSTLEAGTDHICQALNEAGNPGVTFIQAGKLLLNDGTLRKDTAYIKYGENHLKTAEALGLLYELTRMYFVSCIGIIYLKLNDEDRKSLNVRLFLRNKFIARLIKATASANVDARQFLYMLSDSTYIRRKSNIKCILRYLQDSTEYDFSEIFQKIYFS